MPIHIYILLHPQTLTLSPVRNSQKKQKLPIKSITLSINPYNAFVTDAVHFVKFTFFMEFSVLALACKLGDFWEFVHIY